MACLSGKLQGSLKSLIFLFGHPEGFGLPLGGGRMWRYSWLLGPWRKESLVSSRPAGQEIAYGDWFGFLLACSQLNKRLFQKESNC